MIDLATLCQSRLLAIAYLSGQTSIAHVALGPPVP
jgi:hypothetical protein